MNIINKSSSYFIKFNDIDENCLLKKSKIGSYVDFLKHLIRIRFRQKKCQLCCELLMFIK
jgi:hypothetical protein